MACYVCDKLRAGDGVIASDALMVLADVLPDLSGGSPVYLGHLVVEPRRHVAGLAGLTPDEAAALGQWAAGSTTCTSTSSPRYPGTPRDYWWPRLDEWPDAPRGGNAEVTQLVGEIQARLETPGADR